MSMELNEERRLLLSAGEVIVRALGRMFAPVCEVVLHDLSAPGEAIVAIENSISGRKIGDSTTELGIRRAADSAYPEIVQNYSSHFPDGRPAKCTSIGLKDSSGRYAAAICLNYDISLLRSVLRVLDQLTATDEACVAETLRTRTVDEVREALESFAATHGADVRALTPIQRQKALKTIADKGLLRLRGGPSEAARTLGISRTALYNSLNRIRSTGEKS